MGSVRLAGAAATLHNLAAFIHRYQFIRIRLYFSPCFAKFLTMEHEVIGMQPWQVFTAMFVSFWAVSAFFDHFLLTGVFCIAFGVFGEIMTKILYGEHLSRDLQHHKEELKTLLQKVQDEEEKETLVTKDVDYEPDEKHSALDVKEKEGTKYGSEEQEVEPPPLPTKDFEANNEEAAEEPPPLPTKDFEFNEEDSVEQPPPLPTKDYGSLNHDTEPRMLDGIVHPLYNDDLNEKEILSSSYLNGNASYDDDLDIPLADHYDETIEPLMMGTADGTSLDNATFPQMNQIINKVSDDQKVGLWPDVANNEEHNLHINGNDVVSDRVSQVIETSHDQIADTQEEDVEQNSSESYATNTSDSSNSVPESNSDMKVEERESISESEDVKISENNSSCDNTNVNDEELKENSRDPIGVVEHISTNENETPKATVDLENSIVEELPTVKSCDPEIDIDLTDPAVEAAATKIQSAFKGFRTRKKMTKE